MAIVSREIDYHTFAQEIFIGKEVYNKHTGNVLYKYEAYHIIYKFWELVLDNTHAHYGSRNKVDFNGKLYVGKVLKSVKKYWSTKDK